MNFAVMWTTMCLFVVQLFVQCLVCDDCPEIVGRDAWFAERPVRVTYLSRPVHLVIIQHTGSGVCLSRYKCQIKLRDIQRRHMALGNADIPSSFYIGGDGVIYEGTGWLHAGNNTPIYDRIAIGISFIGSYNQVEPTELQLNAAKSLLKCGLKSEHLIKEYRVIGQNQVLNIDSPGHFLYDKVMTWPEWNAGNSKICLTNQFQCKNNACVLLHHVCDGEEDCSDGSDEENCTTGEKLEGCLPTEFKCRSSSQCIPRAFHCNNYNECKDESDEIGCAPPIITRPPTPSLILKAGDVLELNCEASGTPTPSMVWMWKWGYLPYKCYTFENNGTAILRCLNMQPEDDGIYFCMVFSGMGSPWVQISNSIVTVKKRDLCDDGYFKSITSSRSECISCFCFGVSSQCRHANLYTMRMSMPVARLGDRGIRLYGVREMYNGELKIDMQDISSQYHYELSENSVLITSSSPREIASHPYLSLQGYQGNQLKSYGGYINYTLSPLSTKGVSAQTIPEIIIKGKYASLMYYHREYFASSFRIEARLIPGTWQKLNGRLPATREDIMMTLNDIEIILLRANETDGVRIGDFAMESAETTDSGLGVASLVEECSCPVGYEGLSCEREKPANDAVE